MKWYCIVCSLALKSKICAPKFCTTQHPHSLPFLVTQIRRFFWARTNILIFVTKLWQKKQPDIWDGFRFLFGKFVMLVQRHSGTRDRRATAVISQLTVRRKQPGQNWITGFYFHNHFLREKSNGKRVFHDNLSILCQFELLITILVFLAVQDSSIGDLVTHSLTHSLTD